MIQKMLTNFAIKNPKLVMILGLFITFIFLAAFPSLTTDTDPVHMLPQDNRAVVMHNQIKQEFAISDMIGIAIQSKDGKSLFTVDALTKIHKITKEILEIKDAPPSDSDFMKFFRKIQFLREHKEVTAADLEIIKKEDVVSLSTVDDIILNSNGELLVMPMMKDAPKTQAEAENIQKILNDNPLLAGKMASRDGSMVGIFIPLAEGKKSRAFFLGEKMKAIADKYLGENEQYFFGGLPIAESTFGDEMFIQMGVYAPMAGIVILLLMLFFFRSPKIVIAPMILGMMAVTWAMGALIYSGNAIHIMSSMIPIFLLPIAVLNSIHILSKLSDRMLKFPKKEDAIHDVMGELFFPMLYTSFTTIIGFASLATTGIPPVIVFGITIAFGVFLAWLLSMIFIPAYTMLLSDKALKSFAKQSENKSVVIEFVQSFKNFSYKFPLPIIFASIAIIGVSYIGLTKIIVNDNPIRWFKEGHPLRTADVEMNKKLDGTYMANLVFTIPDVLQPVVEEKEESDDEFDEFAEDDLKELPSVRDPKVVNYIAKLGDYMKTREFHGQKIIGGTISLPDVLKKIGKVAFQDDSIPQTREQISQYIFLFESGDTKRGKDLWKMVNRDSNSKRTQMWVFFKSGDNQNMTALMEEVKEYMTENPLPTYMHNGKKIPIEIEWTGLMKINNVWQDEMVSGMKSALLGSFAIVFLMMIFLFRSFLWGVIAMLPLTITIMFIYGLIGFTGKFYDMPIAVLSSLTLGLSVDFAIHFIEHVLHFNKKNNDFEKTYNEIFEGTAQAIWRNVLVVSIGFAPLFLAGLVPYLTVGSFFFLIMIVSGVTTLVLMPAILKQFHTKLKGFK